MVLLQIALTGNRVMGSELPDRDIRFYILRYLDIQRRRATVIDWHETIVTHVGLLPHASYETYETYVCDVA
jgi:hypothetical protein